MDTDKELLWYLNITMSQVIQLIGEGQTIMAVQFLKNAKQQIKQVRPELVQASDLEDDKPTA